MNSLHIIGNICSDVELRTTTSGQEVCTFSVAVNRKKTQQNKDPGADYFRVSAWGDKGRNCNQYLSKGKKVSVVGPVSVDIWESKGKHGASLEVTAEEVEFLSPRSEAKPAQPEPQVDQQTGFQQVETDELPFE